MKKVYYKTIQTNSNGGLISSFRTSDPYNVLADVLIKNKARFLKPIYDNKKINDKDIHISIKTNKAYVNFPEIIDITISTYIRNDLVSTNNIKTLVSDIEEEDKFSDYIEGNVFNFYYFNLIEKISNELKQISESDIQVAKVAFIFAIKDKSHNIWQSI